MFETIRIVILSIVQGVGEFLPISSSGHLVVIDSILSNGRANAQLNILLHFGTLLSILLFYRRRIITLLTEDRRVIALLFVGSLPAVVAGLIIKSKLEGILESPLLTGFMLPVTGYLLLGLSRCSEGKQEYQNMPFWQAFAIGLAQAFAILPGISRSGSTIVAGVVTGLTREAAATFSFLLAIPVIGGAAILELVDQRSIEIAAHHAVLGIILSFGVGYLSLSVLVKMLDRGRLHWFAYWLIPFGLAVVVWQLNVMVQSSLEIRS